MQLISGKTYCWGWDANTEPSSFSLINKTILMKNFGFIPVANFFVECKIGFLHHWGLN
jgi:hypothetical protein